MGSADSCWRICVWNKLPAKSKQSLKRHLLLSDISRWSFQIKALGIYSFFHWKIIQLYFWKTDDMVYDIQKQGFNIFFLWTFCKRAIPITFYVRWIFRNFCHHSEEKKMAAERNRLINLVRTTRWQYCFKYKAYWTKLTALGAFIIKRMHNTFWQPSRKTWFSRKIIRS